MRHELSIDKIPLSNYGVWFDGSEVFSGGVPDVTSVQVPGRNGTLLFDNKRFQNVTIRYNVLMNQKFSERFLDFRAFLYSNRGYRRIEDSHIPNVFRMGRITGDINPSSIAWNDNAAMFSMVFDCKPQLFLTSGEQPYTFVGAESEVFYKLFNPTKFDALPVIKIIGEGILNIISASGDGTTYQMTILPHAGIPFIMLDCEAQEAYYLNTNCNNYIVTRNDTFPKLIPEVTKILVPNGMTIEVIPRWWTL